jgi:hypothetical protein
MTVKINWPWLGSIAAALAGVVGTIITPIYGDTLSSQVQNILLAISGLLLAIPTIHVAQVATARSNARYASELAWENQRRGAQVAAQTQVDQAVRVVPGAVPPSV